jgi:autotransporter-associated beta strand protein
MLTRRRPLTILSVVVFVVGFSLVALGVSGAKTGSPFGLFERYEGASRVSVRASQDDDLIQSDQTWSGGPTGNNTAWYTTANWAGGAVPGSSSGETTNVDVATIPSTGTSNPNATIGINMSTPSGNVHYLGALKFTGTVNRSIGDSSSTAGTLQLNGNTIGTLDNVIIRHDGTAAFTIQDNGGSTFGKLNLALGNPTSNVIDIENSGNLTVSSIISGDGKNLSIAGPGSGIVTLTAANTFTGTTTLSGSTLAIPTFPNGGIASGLGKSSNAASNLVFDGGTLRFNGSIAATTNRNFTINSGKTGTIEVPTASRALTISGGSAATDGSFIKAGGGDLLLSGTYLHSGNTTISGGALLLTGAASIPNSQQIEILGGTVLDVSTLTNALSLSEGQNLKLGGSGVSSRVTTTAGKGITLSPSSGLIFSAFDGGTPSLILSGGGNLTLAATNPVTVNTTTALPAGDWVLITKVSTGGVNGSAPASVTIGGSGIAAGSTATLAITSGQLILHIAADSTQSTDYFRSKASGNWNAVGTWQSSHDNTSWIDATATPDSSANTITIQSGHSVDVAAAVNIDQTVINGTLTAENNTLTVDDGAGDDVTVGSTGTLSVSGGMVNNGQINIFNVLQLTTGFPAFGGTGSFSYDPSATLVYSGTPTMTAANTASTAMFWPTVNGPQNFMIVPGTGGADIQVPRTLTNLTTFGGLYSGQNLTINGTLLIGFGGQVNGSPTYGPNALLKYDLAGHQANRGGEWAQAITSGAGYPHDVQVAGNTPLNVAFGAGSDFVQMGGKLTIDAGSSATIAGMTAPLYVGNGVQLDGTLSLSGSGAGLHVSGGDWNRSDTGVLNAASQTVFFDGTGTQTIYNDNTWDILNIGGSTARTVKFEAGKTQATNGFAGFTVAGTAGNLISLRSTVDGTQWKINAGNGSSVNFANVKDSFAQVTINPTNSVDSGNNTNWNFPIPATVNFSSSVYSAVEGSGQVALTLTRGGSTSTAFSVDVATTSGGTAASGFCGNEGADYQSVQTTVSFASGDETKVVNIPVCSDLLTESPAETFTVTLANPTNGITIGAGNPATVKIIDAATEFTSTTPMQVDADQAASSNLTVTGYAGNVSGIRVTLMGVSVNAADDLDAMLVDEAGHKYALAGDVGGSSSLDNVTLTFEDTGSGGFLPDNGLITEGQNYKPTNCESPFGDFPDSPDGSIVEPGRGPTLTNTMADTFGGQNPNGVWTLYVRNDAGAGLGAVSPISLSGWGIQFILPTAAPISVSGRVRTVQGEGIRGATVTLMGGGLPQPMVVRTGTFGSYTFDGLRPGTTYVVSVASGRYSFPSPVRSVTLIDSLAGMDFVSRKQE